MATTSISNPRTKEPSAESSNSDRQRGISVDDRISSLPDSILHDILSFLPTENAVATGVLSKRWKHLWTNVINLDFRDMGRWKERRKWQHENFKPFVYWVLQQLTSPSIHKFRLELFSNLNEPCDVGSWVRSAVEKNVQDLEIVNHSRRTTIHLPVCVFSCKTLVSLTLLWCTIESPISSFCLPNLKNLSLRHIRYLDNEFLRKLISNCLVLENLLIWSDGNDGLTTISIFAPALKSLEIDRTLGSSSDEIVLEINAPALQYLDMKDHVSKHLLMENIDSLIEAKVDLGASQIHHESVVKCFQAISNVKFLSLPSFIPWTSDLWEEILSVNFSNLIHLTLGGACAEWISLFPYFFRSSDNLQVLKFREVDGPQNANANSLWIDPEHVPKCLLSSLRVVSIDDFSGSENELAMLNYVLKNGRVLETLVLHYRAQQGTKEARLEASIRQKILELPRGSDKCVVKFS